MTKEEREAFRKAEKLHTTKQKNPTKPPKRKLFERSAATAPAAKPAKPLTP